jgi:2,4-dienoyl-CoA reductase-like NADH-dependent reductase (Old Yellow Enzyme family)
MPISTEFPNIFSPIKVGPLTLKNRIQCSPMVSAHAEPLSGNVTQELVAFIGSEARTGAGLVTIGSPLWILTGAVISMDVFPLRGIPISRN